jgi:hypothetical protein
VFKDLTNYSIIDMNFIAHTENRLPYIFKWSNRTQYSIALSNGVYILETFIIELQNKLNLITGVIFKVSSQIIGNITKINIYNENNIFKILLGDPTSNVIVDYLGYDNNTPNYFTKMTSSIKNPNFTIALIDNNNTINIQIIRDFIYTLPVQIYSSIEQLMEVINTGMNSIISNQNYSYSISNNNIISFISPNNPILILYGNIEIYNLAKILGFFNTDTNDYSSTIIANIPYNLSYQLSNVSFDIGNTLTIKQIELKYISIDNIIYNINSRNNIFKFIIKNTNTNVETTYSIKIIEGIYTPVDYVQKINMEFISNSLSITASFNNINQKISFTCSGGFTIKYLDNYYTNKLLAFNTNTNRTFTTILTSDYMVNFEKNKIIFMEFNKEVSKSFFIEIEQVSKLPIILNWNTTISKLYISLKDEYGDPINIQRNWIAILHFN